MNDQDWGRRLKLAQLMHDLVVAEIMTRLYQVAHQRGEGWHTAWYGERQINLIQKGAILIPDGLGVLTRDEGNQRQQFAFFVEVDASREAHIRPSSRIGRKIIGYNRFADHWRKHPIVAQFPHLPVVLFIIQGGEARLQNLTASILKHRNPHVSYGLALREELFAGDDLLTTRAWLLIQKGTDKILGRDRDQREPLLNSTWLAALKPPPRTSSRWITEIPLGPDEPLGRQFTEPQPIAPSPVQIHQPKPSIASPAAAPVKETQPRHPLGRLPMRAKDLLLAAAAQNSIQAVWSTGHPSILQTFQAYHVEPPAALLTLQFEQLSAIFIELDQGQVDWLRKLSAYDELYRQYEQWRFAKTVLILTPDSQRLNQIVATIVKPTLTAPLKFYLVVANDFLNTPHIFTAPIYHCISHQQSHLYVNRSEFVPLLNLPL